MAAQKRQEGLLMTRGKNKLIILIALLFFFYGTLNVSAIIRRGARLKSPSSPSCPKPAKPTAQEYQALKEGIDKQINQPVAIKILKHRLYAVDKKGMFIFHLFVTLEYLISALYILTGVFLILKFSSGSAFGQAVLICDLILKLFFLVIYYGYDTLFVSVPSRDFFIYYFMPERSLFSYGSGLLTGGIFASTSLWFYSLYLIGIIALSRVFLKKQT